MTLQGSAFKVSHSWLSQLSAELRLQLKMSDIESDDCNVSALYSLTDPRPPSSSSASFLFAKKAYQEISKPSSKKASGSPSFDFGFHSRSARTFYHCRFFSRRLYTPGFIFDNPNRSCFTHLIHELPSAVYFFSYLPPPRSCCQHCHLSCPLFYGSFRCSHCSSAPPIYIHSCQSPVGLLSR
ncbi:hypothetical protein CRENBAI_013483 [Crenichthys baileyi]|uniref:Uncharacterized protein n=1 Tax=Crenichthys baileyi TaxID=28760 RepID=A0AAV9SFG6_9TELE